MKVYKLWSGDRINFPRCYLEEDDPWKGVYLFSCKNKFPPPRLPVRYNASNNYALKDFPYAEAGYLVSGKFKSVLEQLSPSLLYFESVIYLKGKIKSEDYYRCVFTKCYDVLDENKITWSPYFDPDEEKKTHIWRGIREIVFNKKKISQNLPVSEKIFKIKYDPIEIFLTEEAKELMESHKIQGISFEEIRVE